MTLNQGQGQLDLYQNVEYNSLIIITSLHQIHCETSEWMPTLKSFDIVCKTVISLYSITQKWSRDVQLKMLHHHIKFHPDQMKSV